MKLIVGLGNPGRKYEGTRHNVGFDVLQELAKRFGDGRPRKAFDAEVMEGSLPGVGKVLLVSPVTFMNLSGTSVLAARDFYKLENDAVLVVCDDFNLPLGKVRLRGGGSAGGQKGLQNIIVRLGTDLVPRLRLGVGAPPEKISAVDHVLGKFGKEESIDVALGVARAADAVASWVGDGLAVAMNKYN